MTTHIAHHGLRFKPLRAPLNFLRHPAPQVSAAAPTAAAPGWVERLAMWAERQPQHHRLGSWTVHR